MCVVGRHPTVRKKEGAVNFCNRQPGTSVTFVDGESEEALLKLVSDADGDHFVAYHLYDAAGDSVREQSLQHCIDGLSVRSLRGELLLLIPKDDRKSIRYRLYNRDGALITSSNGIRTRIYPRLRMEGTGKVRFAPAGTSNGPATANKRT